MSPLISARAAQATGHSHALHYGFAVFCVGVVLFCIAAARWTGPR